jgi:alanine dehydrogenase
LLYLNRDDILKILKMDDLISVMEGAFRELGEGNVEMPLRPSLVSDDPKGSVHVMPAMLKGSRALGLKVVAHYSANPVKFKVPTINATILYLDYNTGRAVGLLDGTFLTAMRTAAVSGLATKYLAKKSSRTLGLIGSGVQAETHLEAMKTVRPIETVRVFSPNQSHREDFAKRMSSKFGIDVLAVKSSREAVDGSEVVVTATPAQEPIVMGQWLEKGCHVNAVGSGRPDFREVDEEVLRRSKIVADDIDAALSETGDFITPIKIGKFNQGEIYASLSDLALGRKPGRTGEDEITLFKSVGLALEDVAAAKYVYDKAMDAGIGRSI